MVEVDAATTSDEIHPSIILKRNVSIFKFKIIPTTESFQNEFQMVYKLKMKILRSYNFQFKKIKCWTWGNNFDFQSKYTLLSMTVRTQNREKSKNIMH